MNDTIFYQCKVCDRILLEMNNPLSHICDHELIPIKPNSVNTSLEKHIPKLTYFDSKLLVKIGKIPHPMTSEHFILWVYVKTRTGGQFVNLTPEDTPDALFHIEHSDILGVYAYCNIHGLWIADLGSIDFEEIVCSPEFPNGCIG